MTKFNNQNSSLTAPIGAVKEPPYKHPFNRISLMGWGTNDNYLRLAQGGDNKGKRISLFKGWVIGLLEPRMAKLHGNQNIVCASKDGITGYPLASAIKAGATGNCAECPLADFGEGCMPRVRVILLDCEDNWAITVVEVPTTLRKAALDFFDIKLKNSEMIEITNNGLNINFKSTKGKGPSDEIISERFGLVMDYLQEGAG